MSAGAGGDSCLCCTLSAVSRVLKRNMPSENRRGEKESGMNAGTEWCLLAAPLTGIYLASPDVANGLYSIIHGFRRCVLEALGQHYECLKILPRYPPDPWRCPVVDSSIDTSRGHSTVKCLLFVSCEDGVSDSWLALGSSFRLHQTYLPFDSTRSVSNKNSSTSAAVLSIATNECTF